MENLGFELSFFCLFLWFFHEKGHLTPLCRDAGATSGCIRHLALISTLSILCRNHITAFISHSHVFISGFSFKNSHFAPFRATWRHIDQLPVSCGTWRSSIFYLTCVRVLRLPLVYMPRSLSQVFSSKTAILRNLAPLPVSCGTWRSWVFYLTCVRVLGLPLVYIPMSLSEVFP